MTGYLLIKRIIDIVMSVVLLPVCLPVIIITALIIMAVDGHNPIFMQYRCGLGGKRIRVIKLRTMRMPEEGSWSVDDSARGERKTGLGRFITPFYIDEMPQLINVIKGDMSLVGPRVMAYEYMNNGVRHNLGEIPNWELRCKVRPGITGLAQVSYRELGNYRNKFRYDKIYIKRQGLRLDFKIMLATLLVYKEVNVKSVLYRLYRKTISPLSGKGIGTRIKPLGWLYRKSCYLLVPEKEKTIDIGGAKIYARIGHGRDIDGISHKLIIEKEYEPTTTEFIRQYMKKGMAVVDVGANIGYYTVMAGMMVGEAGHVVAFEPEENNYKELINNISLNKLKNVTAYPVAISDRNGQAVFYIDKRESGAHSLILCRDFGKKTMVNTIMLDSVVDKPDLIKIDTEGNEIAVLNGAKNILRFGSPVLVIEVWVEGLRKAGYSCETLWEILGYNGYENIYMLDDFERNVYKAKLSDVYGYYNKHKFGVNILCCKNGAGVNV